MTKGIFGERGMVSILGIGILCVLAFFGAAIYAVSELHMASAQRFRAREALRNAADDGVRLAFARMKEDVAEAARAEAATSSEVRLLSFSAQETSVSVYAKKNGSQLLLLGVSRKGEERARAAAVLTSGAGGYVIDHWEH